MEREQHVHKMRRPDRPENISALEWITGFEPSNEELAEIVVCYYNGTDVGDKLKRCKDSLPWAAPKFAGGLQGLAQAIFHLYPAGLPEQVEQARHGESQIAEAVAVAELSAQRQEFCAAVTWLCTDQECDIPEPIVIDVVDDETEMLKAELSERISYNKFLAEEASRSYRPEDRTYIEFFQHHGIDHFAKHLYRERNRLLPLATPQHIIDHLCAFLIRGADLGTNYMPVKLCGRYGCNNLFSVARLIGTTRRRKRYCSQRCQNDTYWRPDRRADFMYVERLIDLKGSEKLPEKLKKEKVQTRLSEIKERWPDWTKMHQRIDDLRNDAAKIAEENAAKTARGARKGREA